MKKASIKSPVKAKEITMDKAAEDDIVLLIANKEERSIIEEGYFFYKLN